LEWGEDLSDRLAPPLPPWPSCIYCFPAGSSLDFPCRFWSVFTWFWAVYVSIILGRKLFYNMLMKAAQCMFWLYQLESCLEARRLFLYFEKKFACVRWRDWGFLTILRFGYAAVGIPTEAAKW
jgi:hypothetical protein